MRSTLPSVLRLLTLATVLVPVAALAVPMQIAHQGQLFDGDGPVTDQVTMVFSLHDDAEAGDEVWSEEKTVDVVDGAYSVLLGTDIVGNPITPVLLDEPLLWLQITVAGGDPLLPRQAVASVPYAVAAGTAENVVGGVVDASEILVDGVQVVDEYGDWTGAPGSVGWDALGDVPGDLSDGDADTLGGLSCADGGRAVYDIDTTSWVCGSQTVTLDRLDTAAASAGEVLGFDGGSVDWIPMSAGGGCTLNPLGLEVAELVCGADSVRVQTTPEYIDLVDEDTRLLADGTIRAFLTAPAPAGTFVKLDGSPDYPCAFDASGQLTGWSTSLTVSLASAPGGAFAAVDCFNNDVCCGILSSGSLTCWSLDGSTYDVQSAPGGQFVSAAVGGSGTACGVTAAGGIECWGGSGGDNLDSHAPSGTGWSLVDQVSGGACAVSPTMTGLCWSGNYSAGNDPYVSSLVNQTLPPGDYVEVRLGSNEVYGLLSSGEVVVSTGRNVPWDFAALGSSTVGVTTEGVVRSLHSPRTVYAP
jgi:hypothetical protein